MTQPNLDLHNLPHDHEAERAVLCATMLDTAVLDDINEILGDDASVFHEAVHRAIWTAMLTVWRRGEIIDDISLPAALSGRLDEIGGISTLSDVLRSKATSANASYYAKRVVEMALKRRAMQVAYDLFHKAPKSGSADELLEYVETALGGLTQAAPTQQPVMIGDLLDDALASFERMAVMDGKVSGVPSGIGEFDAMTGGFQPGNLIIMAARPGIGKSAFALNVTHSASAQGWPVLFLSLEMNNTELVGRLLSIAGGVNMNRIKSGWEAKPEIAKARKAAVDLVPLPTEIQDSPQQTLSSLRSQARRFARKHERGMIVIDYLQLMNTEGRGKQRYEQVGELSRGLKCLAKECNMPILCLAQLSREAESITDVFQKMRCLRESGSLEQDADLVIILDAPDKATAEKLQAEGNINAGRSIDIALAKHRNGSTGLVKALFDKPTQRFTGINDRPASSAGNTADSYDDDTHVDSQHEIDDNTF